MDPETVPAPQIDPAAPAIPEPSAPPVPNVVMQTLEKVKDNVSEVKEKTMEAVSLATATRGATVISTLLIGAGVALFVAFILYWTLTRSGVLKRITYTVPQTKVPKPGYETYVIPESELVIPGSTKERSYSFWMYVNDFGGPDRPGQSVFRHVWHRGVENMSDQPTGSSPLFMLEAGRNANGVVENKLHVIHRSASGTSVPPSFASSMKKKTDYMVATRGITIDYIPVKRWVNITIVINTKSKFIRAYVDGEMVKNETARTSNQKMYEDMDLNGSGPIYIGGKATSQVGQGFSGLVSNIKYFNFVLSSSDAYREYKRGPVDNLMSRMGLPAYELRSPVYKLGA